MEVGAWHGTLTPFHVTLSQAYMYIQCTSEPVERYKFAAVVGTILLYVVLLPHEGKNRKCIVKAPNLGFSKYLEVSEECNKIDNEIKIIMTVFFFF